MRGDPPRVTSLPAAARILKLIAAILLLLAAFLAGDQTANAAEPNLNDGRAHVMVGRPIATPGAKLRRIYPTGLQPRSGVTLIATRSSSPRYFETFELDIVRGFAQRRGYRTQQTAPGGIDLTANLDGKEYRVDRRILSAMNATARRAGGSCTVISGWRDSAKQLKLWLSYLAGTGNPANRPGTSKHEAAWRMPSGAADTYCNNVAFWTWARARGVTSFAKSRGLRQPYAHEPWHVEYVLAPGAR
ncbi:MAG: penicillin-resistant DD-carboxypeptidase [Thermoleophilia bacterium]|nr:penicillin-resistant DD-carboxypeptidase [Thermoleophilia bacterium]